MVGSTVYELDAWFLVSAMLLLVGTYLLETKL
jgi:hypothetical protein